MSWIYSQTAGTLRAPDGTLFSGLYSGHGPGLNNPAQEQVHNIGPIPAGVWWIGVPKNSPQTGPLSFPLSPDPTTNTFGRGGFLIHGDEVGHVGECVASHGCIIANHDIREAILKSPDKSLVVNHD